MDLPLEMNYVNFDDDDDDANSDDNGDDLNECMDIDLSMALMVPQKINHLLKLSQNNLQESFLIVTLGMCIFFFFYI